MAGIRSLGGRKPGEDSTFVHLYMRSIIFILCFGLFAFISDSEVSFKTKQLEYPRVASAYEELGEEAFARLRAVEVNPKSFDLYLRAFKFEEQLEVWAKNKNEKKYRLVVSYPFCSNVGALGPKRKEGDKQIPEGFYQLSKFNPNSNYHLSLKLNYPNASDSILSDRISPGGLIFIHGGCRTVGCIPIKDQRIKELYVLGVEAANDENTTIPIHIFPEKFTEENFSLMRKQYDGSLLDFWSQLKPGYDWFEKTREVSIPQVDSIGKYIFNFGN